MRTPFLFSFFLHLNMYIILVRTVASRREGPALEYIGCGVGHFSLICGNPDSLIFFHSPH